MNLSDLLAKIDEEKDKLGLTDAAVCRQAGISPDVIRNYRRRARDGKTNHRPSAEHIAKIAQVLGIDATRLMEAGNDDTRGFSEGDVKPWKGPDKAAERSVLKGFTRQPTHAAFYGVQGAIPGFSLLPGDVLVLDLKATPASDDLVIATAVDTQTGSATTIIRRFVPPYLIPGDRSTRPITADGESVAILGVVVGSFRDRP